MKSKRSTILVSSALLFLIACSGNKTKVLSTLQMEEILHDTYLAESMYELKYSDFASNDKRELMSGSILDKYGVTREEFDSSLVWYSDNAELFSRVNNSVVSSLKKDLDIVEYNNKKKNSVNFDIIDLYRFLSSDRPLLHFSIDSTEIQNYPNFSIQFNTLGFDNYTNADFVVNYIYSDTTIIDTHKISENTVFSSKINKGDNKNVLKYINGYIYCNPQVLKEKTPLIYDIKIDK